MNLKNSVDSRTWKGIALILVLIGVMVVFYLISGSSAPAVDFELVDCERVDEMKERPDGEIRCYAMIQSDASNKQIRMISKRINKRVLFEHDDPVHVILFYDFREGADRRVGDSLLRVFHEKGRYVISRKQRQ